MATAREKRFQHGRPFTIAPKGRVRSFLYRNVTRSRHASSGPFNVCATRLNEENRGEINVRPRVGLTFNVSLRTCV